MSFERYGKRILKVQLFIEEHLDQDLTLETLAEVANTSPFHFHRIFRAMTGETVAGYVRRVRLEQSSILLKHTPQAITEIAFNAGYQTHEAYTRAFHRRFGVSPSEFRAGIVPTTNYQRRQDFMYTKTYDVRVVEIAPMTVAARRHVGPYQETGPAFEAFMNWVGQNGLFVEGSKVLGICHDDPAVTEPSKIRFDCCVTVDESFEPKDDVTKQQIAGGRYATLIHRGPYTELTETYDWFFSVWLSGSGETLRDLPPFEVYLSDPTTTPAPDLLTEIYLPLS